MLHAQYFYLPPPPHLSLHLSINVDILMLPSICPTRTKRVSLLQLPLLKRFWRFLTGGYIVECRFFGFLLYKKTTYNCHVLFSFFRRRGLHDFEPGRAQRARRHHQCQSMRMLRPTSNALATMLAACGAALLGGDAATPPSRMARALCDATTRDHRLLRLGS